MTITALPALNRTASTFRDDVDTFFGTQLPAFSVETEAARVEINSNTQTATTQAQLATTQAQLATTQATAAASSALSAGATIWVSGTTYTAGVSKYSPLDGQVYRRMITGAGTTDPSQDAVNWRVVNGLTSELIVLPFNNLPVIRPSLNLDFANNQSVDPRITFTRASVATRTNSKGLIEVVASGVPRIDYDAITGACKGLLIEEQRTNLLTYSEQFDNAAWSKVNITITPNVITAPDGTLTADLQTVSTTASTACFRGSSITINTVYTASAFFKAGTAPFFNLSFTDNTDSGCNAWVNTSTLATNSSSFGGWTFQSITVTPVVDGWYRVALTCLSNGTDTTTTVNVSQTNANSSTNATAGQTIYTWGAQLEAGAFPTSYIPTVASQVTRVADVASMTGANFSSWYRQDEGSLLANFILSNVSTNSNITGLSDGTTSNRMIIRGASNSTTASIGAVGGVTQWNDGFTSGTANTITQFSLAIKANDIAMSRNGAPVVTDTSASLPTVNQLRIGADGDGTGLINGHIRSLSYYPKRLTNAELQALSTQ